MIRTFVSLILILTLLGSVAQAEDPDTITQVRLRATVRMTHDQAQLTLGDLARIEGPQAAALQTLAIELASDPHTGFWLVLDLESIREQLKLAPEINNGAIIVHGGDIQITRLRDRNAPVAPVQAVDKNAVTSDGPSLRHHIERWVYARLKTAPESTRIKFNDRDTSMLATLTRDRIVEIREIGRSDMMVLGVVIYEQDRIVLERTIRFEALVERDVLVSTGFIRRGMPVAAESTRVERRWMATTEPIAEPKSSIGQVARNTIDPGAMLLASMLEAPILVKRGQIVSARSLAGSVSVSLKVRAMKDGRLGEIIELESRDRSQRFNARVAGSGRVVIIRDPIQEPEAAKMAGRP